MNLTKPPQEALMLENKKNNMKSNTFFESNICQCRGLATHLRIKKNKDELHKY